MTKSKTTPKNTLTPEIQSVKEQLQEVLEHHVNYRKTSGELYSYHHQMVLHLRKQLEQIDQKERSEKNER